MTNISDVSEKAKAWPFEQARALLKRLKNMEKQGKPKQGPVVFETGYGPSGLPHIGTFGEVVRTTMVKHAFETLTAGAYETKLICISDDMDGMRKIPPTVPNPEILEPYIQMPLTRVPDPFGTHQSYGEHMGAKLCSFLDQFNFDYEFLSATQCYQDGTFDPMLLRALEKFDEIMAVMLPTLGAERQASYSPFLPISPTTGRVLYVPMKSIDPARGTITFEDEDGTDITQPVTGGLAKLQWKPDFGMRWAALGVDFEMFGKDHQDNAPIYSKITRILGAQPPHQFVYELFLDEAGEKISKTKGNGISVEDWLAYAPPESLSLFQYQKPRVAKKLFFDVIPKAVDEYLTFCEKFHTEPLEKQIENPAWHIHSGPPPLAPSPISFALLLNLVSAANVEEKHQLWGFISRYAPEATPESHPTLDNLVDYALRYYEDFVKPNKVYRAPDAKETAALKALSAALKAWDQSVESDALQTLTFSVGKAHDFDNLRLWFQALYEILLGQSQGPRFGGFIALYGVTETAKLIDDALARN